jgi:coenzyme F420-reducing hydrogenase gamma subunit
MVNEKSLEIVYSTLLGIDKEAENFDISLIEGAVVSDEDIERLKGIRKRSKILIAMGSCAVLGGVPSLRRFTSEQELRNVYNVVYVPHLGDALPLSKFVTVDYYLRGCPINKYELLNLLEKLSQNEWFKQEERRFLFLREKPFNLEGVALSLDGERCIVCGRCVKVCQEMTSAIDYINRSLETTISTPFKVKLDESTCISCGQCILYCPVSAIMEKSYVAEIWKLLNSGMHLTAYVEPEVLMALSEALKLDVNGRLVTALKKIGFEKVVLWKPQTEFNTSDQLTIIPSSEAEAIFVQRFYPDLINYMAPPPRIKDNSIVWFSPCVARKLSGSLILTTRELIRLLGTMDLNSLTKTQFDEIKLDVSNEHEVEVVGMEEVRKTLESIREGKLKTGRIVLYVCPGGCLHGGGQLLQS